MNRDEVLVIALLTSFSLLVTTHVTLTLGLLRRKPWWRAPLAFVVAPLVPFWGWKAGMRLRTVLWLASGSIYAFTLLKALR
jgi:hypothetical protein